MIEKPKILLIPCIKVISQIYLYGNLLEYKKWDHDNFVLYIKLLKEYIDNNFLGIKDWIEFSMGQDFILNKNSDIINSDIIDKSREFWLLKKRVLGTQKLRQLYNFSFENIPLYWNSLISSILLDIQSFRKKNNINEEISFKENNFNDVYDYINFDCIKFKNGNNKDNDLYGDTFQVNFGVFSIFLIFQFILLSVDISDLLCFDSVILIQKFIKDNISTLEYILNEYKNKEYIIKYFFRCISRNIQEEEQNIIYRNLGNLQSVFNYRIVDMNEENLELAIYIPTENNPMFKYRYLKDFYCIINNMDRNIYLDEYVYCYNEHNDKKSKIINDSNIKNLIIRGCSKIKIYISRPLEMLHIIDSTECYIYSTNIIGYISLVNNQNITMHIDCMYLKMYQCSNISIFIHIQFSPIILNCFNILIGPYNIYTEFKQTSYEISYEMKCLSNAWMKPFIKESNIYNNISTGVKFIDPEDFFIVHLKFKDRQNIKNKKIFLPENYYLNIIQRKHNLNIIRTQDKSDKEMLINNFVKWLKNKELDIFDNSDIY
ncbi:uncharacterized protein CMU_012450 [Cryptosporidium muris RN66]|uniref:C-CAP/cofactor C-like domain-containing protein n=1 Tax=Cryptosporidium muris (strain RN66) TaxID=441375 RepID=B6AEF4_CRYMR|nr:uncharacterized protein CMU_012450 [Cryptosporidium muris RN66]EEA06571.1 hypothetical protein, conserved [Cryptosporidium muris RN66]|eukprot:XP_002140920.1 hypothetical protein [Cryptosporidium muris RN66]